MPWLYGDPDSLLDLDELAENLDSDRKVEIANIPQDSKKVYNQKIVDMIDSMVRLGYI